MKLFDYLLEAKTKICKHCGGGIMDAKYDDDKNATWECRNCYKKDSRKVYNTKKSRERKDNKKKFDKIFNDLLGK